MRMANKCFHAEVNLHRKFLCTLAHVRCDQRQFKWGWPHIFFSLWIFFRGRILCLLLHAFVLSQSYTSCIAAMPLASAPSATPAHIEQTINRQSGSELISQNVFRNTTEWIQTAPMTPWVVCAIILKESILVFITPMPQITQKFLVFSWVFLSYGKPLFFFFFLCLGLSIESTFAHANILFHHRIILTFGLWWNTRPIWWANGLSEVQPFMFFQRSVHGM